MDKTTAATGGFDPSPRVAVSWGECIDKITILEIKSERLADAAAHANVQRELAHLTAALEAAGTPPTGLAERRRELKAIIETLWAIEDDIRDCEARQDFGDRFIALARSVYRVNDERGRVKRAINEITGSGLVEEKQYRDYGGPGSN